MAMRAAWPGVLFMLTAVAVADPVSDGLQAWRAGDYAQARALWLPAADGGDPQAKFLLSELYAHGQGVPADPEQAVSWLEASARGGYPPACYNLGDRYLNGKGVTVDPARAAYWWRQAAVKGLVQAQYNLGTLYYRGLGVPADPAQAAWWYRQAAEAGSVRARQALDMLREAGVSVPEQAPSEATGAPPSAPTTAGHSSAAVAASPKAETFDLALGPDWLRRQPASHFTIQVFASRDAAAVRRFLAGYRFSRRVAVYPFERDGAHWYGVTYGRFPSREQARSALAELPAAVRRGRPWVRRFKELTALMEKDANGAG